MKVVNMGNIADAFKFDDLPATGIVIEATPEELKLLPNLAYKDVTISEHVGNAAKMREAFVDVYNTLEKLNPYTLHINDISVRREFLSMLCHAKNAIDFALAAPPRNCDVGTDEEQTASYLAFCDRHTCQSCPARLKGEADCGFIWAQMPYEKGGVNGK